MPGRLLPAQADRRFDGHRGSLWLLGLFVALKLAMSLNSIFNTESVAAGADGIALGSFGPAAKREVLTLFALTALGQLVLAAIALAALVRYRALVPLIYLILLGEQLGRRLIVQAHDPARTGGGAAGWYINLGLTALLALGLTLSLLRARRPPGAEWLK